MEISSPSDVTKEFNKQTDATLAVFKRDLQKVRTGRASAGLVEGIHVEHYGSKMPISHLGQISTPEARLILIQAYDSTAIPAIEKAISSSTLGLNPSSEGAVIRIVVPPLTEESRKEIARHLHKNAEDIRISIRNHRRDANDAVKKFEKDGELGKDDAKKLLDEVQKHTDAAIAKVDELLKSKEQEIMEV